jgi:hypothetical protein
MAENTEKGYFDKLADATTKNVTTGFNYAKTTSLGKGFISAVKSVSGYDLNEIDGEDPTGTHKGGKKKGNSIKKIVAKPNQTLAKAKATDEPFTIIDTKNSKFYTDKNDSETYISTAADATEKKPITVGPRPYSAFNKYSLINYRGTPLDITKDGLTVDSGRYRKIDPLSLINPTASQIISITGSDKIDGNYGYRYQYSDFALTKYYGKIPNNMLITLRRFAYPVADDIITPKALSADGKSLEGIQQPDLARAVTWLGEATGNTLADILKFSHGFEWKDAEAKVQELNSQQGAASGKFGSIVESNRFLSAAANAGAGRDAVSANANKQNAGFDAFSNTYPNHVFGPLNVIKNMVVREQGLKFEQAFTLKFEYELKSFEGVNAKIMMLDQLANILALTYNNAPFWGGSVRYISDGSVAKPLGDLAKLRSGDYGGFLGSIVSDMGKMFQGVLDPSSWKNIADNKFLNNLIGGSLMEMFNTPQGGQAVASLLTGDPTGQWHVTIGNPLNPIMVIGNLVMEDCTINFEGPTTIHDFPEKMVVEIKLKPGRPRDKAEIESMFNSGRGRFYIQPDDVADINRTVDVSAYGNKDGHRPQKDDFVNVFRKLSNG